MNLSSDSDLGKDELRFRTKPLKVELYNVHG